MKILIIHSYGMGDMILATPAIECLFRDPAHHTVDVLVTQAGSRAPIQDDPRIRNIYTVSLNPKALLASLIPLRKNRYDAIMVTAGGKPWKTGVFSLLIGAPIRAGETLSWSWGYTHTMKRVPFLHRSESNRRLIEKMIPGVTNSYTPLPYYALSEEDIAYADQFWKDAGLEGKQVFAIHPGSNREYAFRRWPKENYREFIENLKRHNPEIEVLIFAGPDEIEVGEYLVEQCDAQLAKGRSLNQIAAILKRCDYFLNSDSGLGHIAATSPEMKLFIIFGPADERLTGPLSSNCHIIKKDIHCIACNPENLKITFSCNIECLKELSGQEVFEKVSAFLV